MRMESEKGDVPHSSSAIRNNSPEFTHAAKIIDISDNEYWNYCDNCGTRLETFRCRYVCPKCGFFHSCSEP